MRRRHRKKNNDTRTKILQNFTKSTNGYQNKKILKQNKEDWANTTNKNKHTHKFTLTIKKKNKAKYEKDNWTTSHWLTKRKTRRQPHNLRDKQVNIHFYSGGAQRERKKGTTDILLLLKTWGGGGKTRGRGAVRGVDRACALACLPLVITLALYAGVRYSCAQ